MVQEVVKQLGGLHIAINNAGINKNAAAEDTTEEDWDMTFDVNTKGVFLCCQVGKLQGVSCFCAAGGSVLSQGDKTARCLHQWRGPVLRNSLPGAVLIFRLANLRQGSFPTARWVGSAQRDIST